MSFSKTSKCSILVKVQNQNVLAKSNYESVNPYLKHREGTFTELLKKAILIKEQKIEISRFDFTLPIREFVVDRIRQYRRDLRTDWPWVRLAFQCRDRRYRYRQESHPLENSHFLKFYSMESFQIFQTQSKDCKLPTVKISDSKLN